MVPSTIVGDKAGIGIGVEAEITQTEYYNVTCTIPLMPEYWNLQMTMMGYANLEYRGP